MRGEPGGSVSIVPQSGAVSRDAPSPVVKKKGSLRSMFGSFFKSSKDKKANKTGSRYPSRQGEASSAENRGNEALAFSTISLPTQVRSSTSSGSSPYEYEDEEYNGSIPPAEHGRLREARSTTSLPSQIRPPFAFHTPSSSSSSASSLEFPSDVSTEATSPSVSSPSVLMKPSSSQPISTLSHSASSLSSTPSRETSPTRTQSSTKPSKMSKRVPDNYKKQPSPLSTVTGVHLPYVLPSAPKLPMLHERPNSFQPRRRSSLSNYILRRTQSHPDLSDFTTDDLPLFPQMPVSAPPSRLGSSVSVLSSRTLGLRRKSGKADLEAPTSYSAQEKIEHRSILGADPAGSGFYLYPTAQAGNPSRRSSSGSSGSSGSSRSGSRGRPSMGRNMNDDPRRNSWTGPDGHNARAMPPTGRGRKDPWGGRSFGRSVTQQVILEEAGDGAELPQTMSSLPSAPNFNRQIPGQRQFSNTQAFQRSGGSPNQTQSPDMSGISEKKERRRSLHNNWDLIRSQAQIREGGFPHLQVPLGTKKGEDWDIDEKMALRKLQQGAMRFMDASSEDGNGARGNPITIKFGRPNRLSTVGKDECLIDSLPVVRIESVEG